MTREGVRHACSVRLHISDMDCPSCLQKIEGQLARLDGVLTTDGSPLNRTITVSIDPGRTNAEEVRNVVRRLGYNARSMEDAEPRPVRISTWRQPQALIAYASAGLFAFAMLLRALGPATTTAGNALLVGSALVGGWNFFPKGLKAARALALDMNFLMTVAILGALSIGEFVEAAAIAFLFSLAELLENFSADRARASIEALMDVAPDRATVVRDGHEMTVPAAEVLAGDVMVLRPGERIAADGVVVEGASAVDQAAITGESMPVDKAEGDEVFSGTINRGGFLRVRATRPAAESALARIVRLVEEAESQKSPTERFVERFARYYTPTVTVAAVLVMVVPTLVFGAPFAVWFVRALTLLVIACPCALVISTPVAVVSGLTAAARHGVLIKGGTYLEAMGDIRVMAVDKTGTLTLGHPRVVAVHVVDGVTEEEALTYAAAVEARSEHPIAQAIVEAARERGAEVDGLRVEAFAAWTGKGARARVGGAEYVVGKPSLFADVPGSRTQAAELAGAGRTVVGLSRDGELLAWFALADQPREAAAEAVAGLKEAGVRRVVMLTGDNETTARAIGEALGVDEVRAELLPEEKVEAVRTLEVEYGSVAMVGDGVNDGPALARATVGIAMGAAGSDTALETADIALMGDDLTRLPYVKRLSRRARAVIRQNIAAAILVKFALALGVPLGLVSLVTAVIVGDMGVSLAVTLNALRLGRA